MYIKLCSNLLLVLLNFNIRVLVNSSYNCKNLLQNSIFNWISGELMAKTLKQTEERVAEVKRRAEEAVSDVKRQAVVELQKAVRAAEEKANEAVASAHGKMEKAVLEARRQATEDTLAMSNHQSDSSEVPGNFVLNVQWTTERP